MEDVYFKYKFGDDISFELKEGEFVSVIGDNNDLIIHTLLHGNKKSIIEVGDTVFSSKTLDIIRRRMSFVLYKHLISFFVLMKFGYNMFNIVTIFDRFVKFEN